MKKIFLSHIPLKYLRRYIQSPYKIEKRPRLASIFRWQEHHKGFFHADFLGMLCILAEEQPELISFRHIYRLCRTVSSPKSPAF
ncbi:MAG: hypothetical protein ACRCY4_10755 [Brevinema sp.]